MITLSRDAALVLVELELSLDLLLLLRGAVESGLCAQLSLSAALSDFAIDDFVALLDLMLSGRLNSATYLSVGTDILLDLLLVSSVVLLPSDDLGTTSSAANSVASTFCLGGKFIFSGVSLPLLVLRSSCSLAGVFISVESSSLPAASLLTSVSGLLGSGVLTGSGSGIKFAADPVTSSPSSGDSRSISSKNSSFTWKWFWKSCSGLLLLEWFEPGDCTND